MVEILEAEKVFVPRPRRPVGTLGGVQVGITARVYEVQGDKTLVGDVPDDVLLVVREGGLRIEGYVFGHVLASQGIAITGNCQGGWVVSINGDILATRILSGANVISPRGSIHCQAAELPQCIFAGRSVRIEGPMQGGKVVGSRIEIGGAATGCEILSAGPVRAGALRCQERRPLTIALRTWLSTSEYGGSMSEMGMAQRQALLKTQFELATTEEARTALQTHLTDTARCIVLYALSSAMSDKLARQLRSAQAAVAVQSRMINLVALLERCWNDACGLGDIDETIRDCDTALGAFVETLQLIDKQAQPGAREFATASKTAFAEWSAEANGLVKTLRTTLRNRKFGGVENLFETLQTQWHERQAAATDEVARLIHPLHIAPDPELRLDLANGGMEGLVAALRQRATREPDSLLAQRVNDDVFGIMAHNIRQLKQELARVDAALSRILEYRKVLREAVQESGAFVLGDPEPAAIYVRAEHFDAGVVITSSCRVASRKATRHSDKASTIRIGKPIDKGAEFVLENGLIVRAR